mgnify:CR=1 FL=1
MEKENWFNKSAEETVKKLNTNNTLGLTAEEVEKRKQKYGLNELEKGKKTPLIVKFLEQFKDFMIIVLIIAAVVSSIVGHINGEGITDSIIIMVVVIVNAIIGVVQEDKAEKSLEALKKLSSYSAKVIRNGKITVVPSKELVPGDVVVLETGDYVPADMRITEAVNLRAQETSLTGESVPVDKYVTTISSEDVGIGDRTNMVFSSSLITYGRGQGIVVETGMNTEVGKIAGILNNTEKSDTPLQRRLNKLGKTLGIASLAICVVIFIIGLLQGKEPLDMFMTAVSLAVAVIPEGLAAISTIVLAIGVQRMVKKNAIVKKLPAVETLGSATVICSDKTGTLTEDKIVLQKYIDVNGNEDTSILEYAYLNSYFGTGMKNLVDRAIITYGNEKNVKEIVNDYTKIDEIPFDYTRKRMSVVVKSNKNNGYRMFTKGALEEILKVCTKVKYNGHVNELTPEMVEIVEQKAKEYAVQGMQVIAIASKREYRGVNVFNVSDEANMTFIGFVAFLDPAKKDVKSTLKKLKNIGITTKILTGDNPYAANNICNLVGLENKETLLGTDIDKMSDEELAKKVEEVNVFARMNPLQKERVVKQLKNNGHVVGYMGDGVNDSPSLHIADVGISVNTATDIAKEAADIILLERSLKVIYEGVIEGRRVYGNIIKYMKMALSSDFGDVFSIVIASIFLPFLPLLPIQMLLQDFLYDISQIAIPYDDVDKEFLEKPKKWSTKGISKFMNVMGITSSLIDVLAFLGFWFLFGYNASKETFFQTAWFVECLISETMIIHYVRTAKRPFIESRANKWLTLGTFGTIIGTILTPILLHNIPSFHFEILPLKYYGFVILLLAIYSVLVEIIKKIYIKKNGEWL